MVVRLGFFVLFFSLCYIRYVHWKCNDGLRRHLLATPKNEGHEGDVTCHIVRNHIYYRNNIFGTEGQWECIALNDSNHRSYTIQQLPPDFVQAHSGDLHLGNLQVLIEQAILVGNSTLVIAPNSSIRILSIRRQLREAAVGKRRVLAMTISTRDSQSTYTAETLYPYLFGKDLVSVVTQMEACSAGKLLLEPIFGGVVDIALDGTMEDYPEVLDAVQESLNVLQEQLQIDSITDLGVVDHLLFCMPPGMVKFAGSATTNHYRSIYNDVNCARLSVLLHEIGHNLGLAHANQHGFKYQDRTGYMGSSQRRLEGPQKCFNSQNHWHLGWFRDRTWQASNYQVQEIVELASFVDYALLSVEQTDYPVLVDLEQTYFLQFNRAKYHNAGTGQNPNQVILVQAVQGGTELLAGLDLEHHRFEIPNFLGTSSTLVIDVCDMIVGANATDRVVLSIGLDISVCLSYSLPKRKRAQRPTEIPTIAPSSPPSLEHTHRPSTNALLPPSSLAPFPNPVDGEDTSDIVIETQPTRSRGFWSLPAEMLVPRKLYEARSRGWYAETVSNPHSRGWYAT